MEPNEQLQTQRLILRRYREADLNDLHEYLSDAQVVKFEPYSPMSMDEVRENLAWRIGTDEMIAIVCAASGKMIGNVYLGKRDFDSLEIGYVLNRRFWGMGYACEACGALISLAFAQGVHRIYAECDPENNASWRLLERLGFRREGCLRQNLFFRTDELGNPIWKDTYVYALLCSDNRP